MKSEVYERFKDYDQDHCWQYQIRKENFHRDVEESGMTLQQIRNLTIDDFGFEYIEKSDKIECDKIKQFIQKHEWLGKLPARPTHRFVARLRKNPSLIAGAIVMATPNAFSYILGKNKRDLEKLISRGACISWAPKNLNSWLIMNSIRWMVRNTPFRAFSAYSDPEAKELGTIYQACNFIYMGQQSGTIKQYFDPNRPDLGWFSDREFRKQSKYYMYAKNLGIDKEQWRQYMNKWSPNWDIIPDHIREQIKREENKYRNSCQSRFVPAKHKYVYILGKNKSETKYLKKLFDLNNPLVVKSKTHYPKTRGE